MTYIQDIKWKIDNTGHKGDYFRNKGLDQVREDRIQYTRGRGCLS